jgi:hypothetical protein
MIISRKERPDAKLFSRSSLPASQQKEENADVFAGFGSSGGSPFATL